MKKNKILISTKTIKRCGYIIAATAAVLLCSCERTRSFEVEGKVTNSVTGEALVGLPVDLGFYSDYGPYGDTKTDSEGNYKLSFETEWDEPIYLQIAEKGDFVGKKEISEEIKEEGLSVKNIEFKPSTMFELLFIKEQDEGIDYSFSVSHPTTNFGSHTFASGGQGDSRLYATFGADASDNSYLTFTVKYEARDEAQNSAVVEQFTLVDSIYIEDASQTIRDTSTY